MNEPRMPSGNTPEISFMGKLMAWIRSNRTIQIVGFRKIETSDGITFIPERQPSNTTSEDNNQTPKWG